MSLAARFDHGLKIRAGYSGAPGTAGCVELFFPCVGCWEEKDLVGAIVGMDQRVLIHVEEMAEGERCSPAYYCETCWARDVEPLIEALEGGADVTLIAAEGSS